ncbi:MAG: outer membrane lipoprotein carrier protein LolA [Alphaproteobacteria bacterium]|nr:outer membrane lipoprotein carrier protein LolA [Alphaproteobacteria bacterium]
MKKSSKILIVTSVVISLLSFRVNAQETAKEVSLSADDAKIVKSVEEYFNTVKSIKSRFTQYNRNNGQTLEGNVNILKPNKMRLQYDEPVPFEFIADGYYLIYNDKKLEQVTYFDLNDNPAAIILKDNFSFTKEELKVEDISKQGNQIVVTVSKIKQPEVGKITLIFDGKPMGLKQWVVTDMQHVETEITLVNPEFNVELDEQQFKFKDKSKSKLK